MKQNSAEKNNWYHRTKYLTVAKHYLKIKLGIENLDNYAILNPWGIGAVGSA